MQAGMAIRLSAPASSAFLDEASRQKVTTGRDRDSRASSAQQRCKTPGIRTLSRPTAPIANARAGHAVAVLAKGSVRVGEHYLPLISARIDVRGPSWQRRRCCTYSCIAEPSGPGSGAGNGSMFGVWTIRNSPGPSARGAPIHDMQECDAGVTLRRISAGRPWRSPSNARSVCAVPHVGQSARVPLER
jgi:hypothetical protein